jgi:hypothetical protein
MSFLEKKRFSESLEYRYLSQVIGGQLVQLGKELYQLGQVEIVSYSDTHIECRVTGNSSIFQVKIKMAQNQIFSSCECRTFIKRAICKHIAAAAIAGQKILSEELKKSWESRLLFVHQTPNRIKEQPKEVPEYVLAFILYTDYNSWKIKPMTALVNNLIDKEEADPLAFSQEHFVETLARSNQYRNQFNGEIKHPLRAEACLNAPHRLSAWLNFCPTSAAHRRDTTTQSRNWNKPYQVLWKFYVKKIFLSI